MYFINVSQKYANIGANVKVVKNESFCLCYVFSHIYVFLNNKFKVFDQSQNWSQITIKQTSEYR